MNKDFKKAIDIITRSGQKVQRPMTLFFAAVYFVTFFVVFSLAINLTNDIFNQQVEDKFNKVKRFYNEQISDQKELQELILLSLLNDNDIVQTVQSKTNFKKFDSIFAALEPYNITHFYIFSPERVVIHRAHSPNRNGDVINRANLLESEKTRTTKTGLLLGKIGAFTLRSTTPVIKDGQLLGYLEVGMELGHVAERTEQQFDVWLYEFFNKEQATKNRNKLHPLTDRLAKRDLNDKFIINSADNASFDLGLIEQILNTNQSENKQTLSDETAITTNPIVNFTGENVGFLAIITDVSDLYQSRNKDLATIFIVTLLIGAASLFAVNLALRYLEHAIKNFSAKQYESEQQLKMSLQQLKDSQDIIVKKEKFASLGTMVAGVAHEVNTPLGIGLTAGTAMLNEVQHLSKDLDSKTLTQHKLAMSLEKMDGLGNLIDKNLHRASSLVQSFKQVAVDQSSEQARDVKMKILLEEIVTSLEPQLKKGKHIVNIHCDKDLTITTIPGYWSQVLFNLINNSLIHGFAQQEEKVIDITLNKKNSMLILQYKDNGVGLTDTCKKNIFEPFYTTKRNEGGSGLGMHLVFNIVTQALKGDIELVEPKHQGAAFKITVSAV